MANLQTDSPWLARPAWADGRIESSQTAGLVLPWVMAAGCCVVTSAYLAAYGLFRHPEKVVSDPSLLVVSPFVIVSLGLLVAAVRSTWLAARSGASMLELSTLPGVIGGELAGVIHLPKQLRVGQSIRLILTCTVVPWRERSPGRSSCSPYTAWEDDREVVAGSESSRRGDTVPVHFTIPPGAEQTTDHQADDSGWHAVKWILEALGEPGKFWRGQYEVPVFRTPQSPPADAGAGSMGDIGTRLGVLMHGAAFADSSAELVARPASTRIETRFTADGLEIRLPNRGAFLAASLWVVMTLPLYAAAVLDALGQPAFALLSVGGWLCAALLLNALPALFLVMGEPRRVIVGRREIVVQCGWPVLGLLRRFPLQEYDGIDASPMYFAVLRKGASYFKRRFFLATKLQSNAEGRWLASEIDRAVRHNARFFSS